MDSNRPEEKAADAADAMVRAVALIFEDALQIGGSTPDDNWTSLGGNSLESIDAALALAQRFEVEIPPETFDPGRTIREWARWIESRGVASTTRQGI
jgi:acyl carrier protein